MPANHHQTHKGLQAHSVGELYPWTIAYRGSDRVFALNCIDGRKSKFYPATAVSECEDWVHDRIVEDAAARLAAGLRHEADKLPATKAGNALGYVLLETADELDAHRPRGPYLDAMEELSELA